MAESTSSAGCDPPLIMLRTLFGWTALAAGLFAFVAIFVTPWPSVLIIRAIFDAGAREASEKLVPLVPPEVRATTNLSYDDADPDARFDIYRPANVDRGAPTIIWFHGGGFVSGRRQDVANYLKILAGRGFVVVNVDYTIAPEARYPTPIRQAHSALGHLASNAPKLGINANRMVLAGDSAGAQIAAQTAATIANPAYAAAAGVSPKIDVARLAGVLLHCGVYDIASMGGGGGITGWFVRATSWAHSGQRHAATAPGFDTISVLPHVTAAFPPAFISAGNADPLAPQSVALAAALRAQGVAVTERFYPADHRAQLGHEYQFDLGTPDGRAVLDASVAWLRAL